MVLSIYGYLKISRCQILVSYAIIMKRNLNGQIKIINTQEIKKIGKHYADHVIGGMIIQEKMIIKLPFKTPTVNLMYATFNGNRVKSKVAKELSKEVGEIVRNSQTEILKVELKVDIEIHSNWYNKDGTIKKRDIANLEKFITDSIFAELEEMDDSQIFKLTMKKIQSDEEFTIIKIK